jgi:Phospholipase_D-nuclease N-terminal
MEILVAVLLAWFAFWLITLVQILRTPDEEFERAGQIKLLWLIGVFVFQFFGVIAYYAVARPRLQAADRTLS